FNKKNRKLGVVVYTFNPSTQEDLSIDQVTASHQDPVGFAKPVSWQPRPQYTSRREKALTVDQLPSILPQLPWSSSILTSAPKPGFVTTEIYPRCRNINCVYLFSRFEGKVTVKDVRLYLYYPIAVTKTP
ncbi:hypothetical protein STEG23_021673, partial [Scotinomys teguina]